MRVLILGAGFGGLEISSILSAELGEAADTILIDRSDGFVFGFSKLDVMFGRIPPEAAVHRYADLVKSGVRFVQTEVRSIDPVGKTVVTDAGVFGADALVVALGAEYDPSAIPGLVEGGHEFYSVAGATAARDVLARFDGGRVVVGVTSTPFKCPPAPSETSLLLHDHLTARGLRDRSSITQVMPFGVPIPPSPDGSAAILAAFAERGIEFVPDNLVRALDPSRRVAILSGGSEIAYDLFLGVPPHRVPRVVEESGMAEGGWIPVDFDTLQTRFPDVYAVGDVTSVGTPKAGVFAEGQARIVAERLVAQVRGRSSDEVYGGRGVCYMEFGTGKVAGIDVTFPRGAHPFGSFVAPDAASVAAKEEFGASRLARWFGTPRA